MFSKTWQCVYSKPVKIRDVASLLGTYNAYGKATKWGGLFVRCLEREKISALRKSKGNFDRFMSLSEGTKETLKWWLTPEVKVPAVFGPVNFSMEVHSDASEKGWGAHSGGVDAGGRWEASEAQHHINWLELKACFLAVQSFAAH